MVSSTQRALLERPIVDRPSLGAFFEGVSPWQKIKWGTERVERLLALLGRPDRGRRYITVAGTNAKGSVTLYLAALLRELGFNVGANLSPHISEIRERIQLGGSFIAEPALMTVAERLRTALLGWPEAGEDLPTYHELWTVAAIQAFHDAAVEWGVLEVGMGGRYDAARAMAQDVTVFTPIGFDHMQFLGNTLEAIATEKAQIMRPGSLAICCPDQRPEVVTVLGHHAMKVGAALEVMSNLGFNWMFRGVPADPGFDYHHGGWRVDDLTPGLRGRYQAANAATALFTVQAMVGRGLLPRLPTDMEARSAIASVTQRLHPGRYEVLCNEPPIWCEGGHNPMALRTFVFNLTPLVGGRNGHLLLAFKADKDITEAVAQLAPLQPATVTCTQYLQHQPCPPEEVAAAVRANLPEATVLVEPDLRGALQGVANRCAADPRGAYGLVIGSLYLAGDVRNLIMAGEVPGVPWRLAGQGPGD